MIEKARVKVERRLADMGVELKVKVRLNNVPQVKGGDAFIHDADLTRTTYLLSDGSSVSADLAIVCTGLARRQGNLVTQVDASNQVTVQQDLQVKGLPKVYCVGDANDVAETKMAYFAAKQGELAARNVLLSHAGKPTLPYVPMDGQKEHGLMLVPLGPEKGVTAMGDTVLGDGMTSLIKGKGLLTKRTFGQFSAPVPAL
jgi:NADH dehydrogenase FAD-containing subunit